MLSACTQLACPFLIFLSGLLAVPLARYLERGTLFYAAETASPRKWRHKGERMVVRELDPKKKEIIEHVDGPLLVIAGPGAGKTMAIVERVVHLIAKCGVAPESILVSTFTEKAAAEYDVSIPTETYITVPDRNACRF